MTSDENLKCSDEGGLHQLLAALEQTRSALASLAERILLHDRSAKAVTGSWTLREVIIHLTEWEKIGLGYAERVLNGETTKVLPGFSEDRVDQINATFIDRRRGESWEEVWADYDRTRQSMIAILESAPATALSRTMTPPWDGTLSLAEFFNAWAEHDQEHLEMIRRETNLFD